MARRKAILVGGGIGGLAAAVALLRAGLDVVVAERASELREVGAGLTVWPNAMKALRALGLDEPVWAVGRPFGVGRVYDERGRVLIEGARREVLEKRFGWPGTVLHRHQLLRILAERLPPGTLRLGVRCTGFRQDAGGVTVTFADGREERGDLLVGADGLHSVVRCGLFGRSRPRYAGYTAYRGINRYPLGGDIAYESWGVGRRFGFVPGPGGDVYWWAALNGRPGLDPSPEKHKSDLLSRFRGWFDPIAALIEATADGTILRNDIFDRPPAPRWSVGRVTLLGDAAHPVTPDLGQGACLAIEDAVVLGHCLAADADVALALRAYERQRLSRARFLTRNSRWMGHLGQIGNEGLARVRNGLVRLAPPWASLLWLSWQFGFDPPTG